ncbi:hypothetical protein DEIPH_ctg052orf0016 [Deinococcus phoenicis]|uniref:Uncharacterized protein n=1 Tax=Deinococcus phoenicis TaxID=1476583 RepID=A0A016QM15_9DEIO|nr:hypothetical protein DEIPH_ctg052orf0016 [Deinococcus phoenicis]
MVLRAWPATVADAHLTDLLTVTATLGAMREEWPEFQREDVELEVWAAFRRLVRHSLEAGSVLPRPLTWADRLSLLDAMFVLNDIEEAEGKLQALGQRAARLLTRIRGRMTAHSTNSSSGSSGPPPMPA